jgi:AcrR family transcriptional regulator
MFSERQAEIIEKSIEIIANKGIQGLTIKNLSKEIGFSEPAIYRHFKSKSDILIAILSTFEEMAEMMGEMMKNSDDVATDKLSYIFDKMIQVFEATPALVSVIFAEEIFKNEDVLKNKIIGILEKNEETIEGIMKEGQAKGGIRDDLTYQNLALIVMGSLRLLVKRWDLGGHQFPLKKEGMALTLSLKNILSSSVLVR